MTDDLNIRSTFLPDEGCVMVRVDLSQIEDRICKMYCGTPRTIELANLHPTVYDAHTANANVIFKENIDKLPKEERKQKRYLGKKCVHASERKMQGVRMSESVAKDTNGEVFIHPRQCDRLIRAFLDSMPELESIYFPFCERTVRDVGVLETSWGRRLDVRNRRVDNDLYREAYSFFLQAEAADWTNQYLFIPTFKYMTARFGRPPNGQVHDEVIVSAPYQDAWEVATFMVSVAQRTRETPKGSGNLLTVPAEVTIGRNWGDKEAMEFEIVPERGEFYEILKGKGFEG